MAETFAEKFEKALAERRQADPGYGLRTLARQLSDGDPEKTKTILRRLQKYRPKPGRGGAGEVAPTEPTRREIERALGLPEDALAADRDLAEELVARAREQRQLAALRVLLSEIRGGEQGDVLTTKSNAPAAPLAGSTAGASTPGGYPNGSSDPND